MNANDFAAQSQNQPMIYVDPATGCLYIMHPATGQPTWIVDYETGQPMVSRQLFTDPTTGGLCAVSATGTGYVWVINPATGMPIVQPTQPAQSTQLAQQLSATTTTANAAQSLATGFPGTAQSQSGYPAALQQSAYASATQGHIAEQAATGTYAGNAGALESATTASAASAFEGAYAANGAEIPIDSDSADSTEDVDENANPATPSTPARIPIPAILGPVLAVSSIGVSFILPISIGAPFVALLGLILSIAGAAMSRNRNKGMGASIVGIVLSIAAAVVIALTNSAVATTVGTVLNQPQQAPASASSEAAEVEDPAPVEPVDYASLAVGQTLKLDDGLTVSVTGVKTGLKGSKDKRVTGVAVKYVNTGTAKASYDTKNWKTQNAKGEVDNATTNSVGSAKKDSLGSGEIEPGKTVTGTVYFAGDLASVSFYKDAKDAEPAATWML